MSTTSRKVNDRKKPTTRGRQGNAKAGNYKSIVEKIKHEEEKFSADAANSLADLYKEMLLLAKGKGKLGEMAGIKDRVAAMKFVFDHVDGYMDDHYTAEEEDSEGGSGESVGQQQEQKEATNGSSLIKLFPDEE